MRKPDFIIGGADAPYMLRWYLIPRNRWFNVYLHQIIRSDDDRALHDHRAWNCSIVLKGSYTEVMPDLRAARTPFARIADLPQVRKLRRRGAVVSRRASDCHRLEVVDGPVWTLWLKGPDTRDWGFHCAQGFIPWQKFVASDDEGAVGRGCEQ